ncbi:efflux RND transporter periplasmic adaptor subunit [Limnochorda pilosa]|uniref:RND transporter n=1 Tax=Limnochorda pilosa TaxID=1555112 RepID=A0A0K2SNN8_LIMPI|nr:efflux RND transporter periplasmic adaptor subunit [Limnochorda pilosa]BAS28711.1 RND transporter [Limnochorda pilosa]
MTKRVLRIALWAVVLAAVGGSGFYLFVGRSAGSVDAALLSQVRQVQATRGPMESTARVVGTLEPVQEADVVARVSGVVHELPVREGEEVESGQLLVGLDPSDLQLDLQKAQAALRAARAQLEELENGPAAAQVLQARNDVAGSRADATRLQADVASARRLAREGALSQQDLQQKEDALAAAERTLHLAQQRLAELEQGATPQELERARAQVAQAEADAARAEVNLRRARVSAPMDGAVLELSVRLGQPVEAGATVARLGRTDRLEVVAPVNEMDVPNVRTGQRVRVQADALGGRSFEGSVTAVAPRGNRNDNVATFDVTVSLENPDDRLRPGMTATAEIVLERRDQAVRVPLEALIQNGGKDAVVVQKPDGSTEVVSVTLGLRNDREAEVREGLSGDEMLVILPVGITPQQYMAAVARGAAATRPAEGGSGR